ncbi:MAG: DUF1972 domain-containing protein [Lachnospiraceae bacterium]|nr:DUF1972 domain-containing protein [Lachnospiraceae bacterium]
MQDVFIIGAKSIGQYGGYETFVNRLITEHEANLDIRYHVICKANGDGCMDETKLSGVEVLSRAKDGSVSEFSYRGAHVIKIPCPNIGAAVAVYYDRAAVKYCVGYCKRNGIQSPVFYILTCRIGLFISSLSRKIRKCGGRFFLNPDGHEWKRAKWNRIIRAYWKWSEKKMVGKADLVICDSLNIEKYIKDEYHHPNTTYIAYGADVTKSTLSDNDSLFTEWLQAKGLNTGQYYLIVGRFVPENNYETIIREFMKSNSRRKLAIITNANEKFLGDLETRLHFMADERIQFVGTVYNQELLKKIRECAYGYFHGHEVGGTNPSLLEALGSTDLNLLLDVGFNREVGLDSALYWNKESGNLSNLINEAESMEEEERKMYAAKAKKRISDAYSWKFIADEYEKAWKTQ